MSSFRTQDGKACVDGGGKTNSKIEKSSQISISAGVFKSRTICVKSPLFGSFGEDLSLVTVCLERD